MKTKIIAAALAGTLMLTGCSFSFSGSSDSSSSSAIQTDYSLDELKAMLNEEGMISEYISDRGDADYSDEAVKAYNSMLTYAEEKLGGRDYKLFDLYYVDQTDHYVVKLVLDEYKNSGDTENAPVMLSCNRDGRAIKSHVEGFVYAREWEKALAGEINALYPDYHLNSFYLLSDYVSLNDGENKYKTENIGKEELSGDWSVNIIPPAGTSKDEFSKSYKDIKPILDKYSVSELTVYVPDSKTQREQIIRDETITNNCYYYTSTSSGWIERNYKGGN